MGWLVMTKSILFKIILSSYTPKQIIKCRCSALIKFALDQLKVKALFDEAEIREKEHASLDILANILVLVVKYECDKVEGGAVADIPQFVHEDREPLYQTAHSKIKMPRDTPRLRDGLPCEESRHTYTTIKHNEAVLSFGCYAPRTIKRSLLVVDVSYERLPLQEVLSEFSQVVLLKIAPLAEETPVSWGFFVALVLQSGELNATREVCDLEHPVFSWMCFPVHHRTLEEGVLKRRVKDASDEGLSVIVVDLDEIEFDELIEIVKQELGQVALHGANELIRRLESILSVSKDVITKRHMLRERTEGHEELGAPRRIEVPVLLVCPEKRVEVEGDVWEVSVRERLLIQIDRAGEIVALVMKDQGEQVVLGFSTEVAGLIYKDGELIHETSPLDTKSAGGNPPALDSPLLRDDHLSYTTSRSAESIVCEPEHKFAIIEANTCSTYRRAA